MTLKDYLAEVTSAPTVEDLWDMHTEKMAEYGFDRILYGFTRYMTASSLGNPQDLVILTNHQSAYISAFIEQGLYFHAPMVNWARNNDGAASWDVIRQMESSGALTASERSVLEFNKKMDVVAGYTVSFKAVSARSKGAIALTAQRGMTQAQADDVWAEHGADIVLMNNVAHLKIITLPYSTGARSLTRRQREVLEWVGDGKTTQDIAMLMGLTVATVDKHLRLAREALDVDTTAQAVLKAAFQNQMFVLEV
ncbi:MAG: LuxR family transcriptional regulator [Pseudomonadota bacterium]